MSRICISCSQEQALDQFRVERCMSDGTIHRAIKCRVCDPRPDAGRPSKARVRKKRLSKYQLREEEMRLLEEAQQGACAICRRVEKLVIDHCHETGRVRGLLCTRCNTGLGWWRDDPEMMRSAANYIEAPKRLQE